MGQIYMSGIVYILDYTSGGLQEVATRCHVRAKTSLFIQFSSVMFSDFMDSNVVSL